MTRDSYWCYTCNSFVRMRTDAVTCPECTGRCVEQMDEPVHHRRVPLYEHHGRTFPDTSEHLTSPFNPIIALREPDNNNDYNFQLYYSLGINMGLRRLPVTMSDSLKANGLERMLDQLLHASELGQERPSAHDSMRNIKIESKHVGSDSHCAVCQDPFELGSEAQEMPCKHVYHEDCILPWLSSNNSCPLCRRQMPTNSARRGNALSALTIWRLPGGGFAVGYFPGTARHGIELPIVYTEPDGTLNNNIAALREVPRSSRRKNRFSKFIQRVFGCFGPSSSNSN